MHVSRRELFKYAAVGSAAAMGLAAVNSTAARADGLGTLVDYSGGVPSAAAIAAAGHLGAVRYVSDRRPGADWMIGKPLKESEADALAAAGLEVVSNYQYGKGDTSDWRGGYAAGVKHAKRGLELHTAAGGPANRPIYASIDDNPTAVEFATMARRTPASTQTHPPSNWPRSPVSVSGTGSTIGERRRDTGTPVRICIRSE